MPFRKAIKFKDISYRQRLLHALVTALFCMLIFIAMMIIERLAPFGDKTYLMFDMKRQYVDFYSYLKSVYSGENNIFYSFSTALGSGAMGLFSYYLASPFLLILNFFTSETLPLGIILIICLKLMTAAFIMDLFLQKRLFADDQEHSAFIFCTVPFIGALSWAFSSYLMTHSMNTMWIDVILLLPLTIEMLERLLQDGRKTGYVLCLAAMMWLNYYIAWMCCIFIALWTVLWLIRQKDSHSFRKLLQVAAASVLSAMLSGITLMPTVFSLMNSPKDNSQAAMHMAEQVLGITQISSKLTALTYDSNEIYFGLPQIYCGILMMLFTLYYLAEKQIRIREKLCTVFLYLILYVSFCNPTLNLLWHGGMDPYGYPYRYAFLWIFLTILCGAQGMGHFMEKPDYITLIIAAIPSALILYLGLTSGQDHISLRTVEVNLILIAVYFLQLAVLFLTGRFARNAAFQRKVAAILFSMAMLFQLMEVSLNGVYIFRYDNVNGQSYSEYRQYISQTGSAVDQLKEMDSDFYRMENLNPRSENDSLQFGYYGMTHYSSSGLMDPRYFMQRLGFHEDGLLTHYGNNNTATADSILGIRYVISDGELPVRADYQEIVDGNTAIYQNPYALPIAVGVSQYTIKESYKEEPVSSMDPFALQENVLDDMTGKKNSVFKYADIESTSGRKDNYPSMTYLIHPVSDGNLYFYLNGILDKDQNLEIFIEDDFYTAYGNKSCLNVLNLGDHTAGETIRLTVVCESDTPDFGQAIAATEDIQALHEAVQPITEGDIAPVIHQLSSSHLSIDIDSADGLFTTIPYEKGWNITVDGEKIEPVCNYGTFLYVPLDSAGDGMTHHIDMYYIPPGMKIGAAMSICGLLILLILHILKNRQPYHK